MGNSMRKLTFAITGTLLLDLLLADPWWASADGPTWTLTGNMAVARRDHTATLLDNGKVLIQPGTPAELYDPATGTFTPTGPPVAQHGSHSTATRLADGRILIVGGSGAPTSAEIYDPATGAFSLTGSLNVVHTAHTATLLHDGRVLIAGGQDDVGPQTHAIAELYDPVTGTFALTGSLNTDRSGYAATLLPDGRVLVSGGTVTTTPGFGLCTASAELYDPITGTFGTTGNMAIGRCDVPQAPVLIIGGIFTQSAELFDPATGTFSATGSMTTPRAAPTATLLLNGQVLLAGGAIAVGPVTTNSAELYDPLTDTFSATASMAQARQQHRATLLPNGQVLVTGGFGGDTNLSSAELFVIPLPIIPLDIDIKRGSDPNSINLKSKGVVPVAILGSSIGVTTIDQSTVTLGDAPVVKEKKSLEDVDGDGELDLVLQFRQKDIGLQPGDTEACITGAPFDGTPIEGCDSVRFVP